MKTLKRMLAVMLAVVMMMGLGVTSMARETTYAVKIYLQTATRNASGVVTGTDKLNSGNPVTVTVNAGTTYADAIDQACATSGSGISNAVWTGTTDKYLDSLKVGDKTYTNKGSYPNANTYIGNSWMYFNGEPSTIPADINSYPDVVLSKATVNGNVTFTLSYESMIYTW